MRPIRRATHAGVASQSPAESKADILKGLMMEKFYDVVIRLKSGVEVKAASISKRPFSVGIFMIVVNINREVTILAEDIEYMQIDVVVKEPGKIDDSSLYVFK